MKYCDQCGNALRDSAKFCPACGRRVEDDKPPIPRRCKKCGEPLEDNASFCANCGEPCCITEPSEQGEIANKVEPKEPKSVNIELCVLGFILMIAGGFSISHGNTLNHSVTAQLSNFFSTGTVNPGGVWLILGVIVAFWGLLLVICSFIKD